MSDLPDDAALLDTATDVIRRFKGFGSYGSLRAAQKALARRCPGRAQKDYAAILEYLEGLYMAALSAIDLYRAPKSKSKRMRLLQRDDIDFDKCLAELDQSRPGYALAAKHEILNWVIYWHYLR